jgi:hypothetical protein
LARRTSLATQATPALPQTLKKPGAVEWACTVIVSFELKSLVIATSFAVIGRPFVVAY